MSEILPSDKVVDTIKEATEPGGQSRHTGRSSHRHVQGEALAIEATEKDTLDEVIAGLS